MALVVPVALAVLVMLPRLASPEFGLLDDGVTVHNSRAVVGRWSTVMHLIPETGRFFPAYWATYAAVFGLVGARPLAFFGVNVVVFAAVLAILVKLVRLAGGTPVAAAVAALLFALSGPAIETFYTLSKAEPFQLLWIGVSLLAAAAAAASRTRARRASLTALTAIALLLACATKETGVVLVVIAVGWLAIERRLGVERPDARRFAATYALASVVAAVTFALLRWSYAPLGLAEGTYTRAYSPTFSTVGSSVFRISTWLVRDFAFLVPLLAFAVPVAASGRLASRRLVAYAGVWMAGWLAVFMPWPATFEYYLLPFAGGAAALGGALIADAWTSGRDEAGRAGRGRRATACLLVLTVVLWSATIVNVIADARVQLAVDRANAELVTFLADVPRDSHVVLNTVRVDEYVYEVPLHLSELNGRPDVVVTHVSHFAREIAGPSDVFVATPVMTHAPAPTVRIGVDEIGVQQVDATLGALGDGRGQLVYSSAAEARLLEVGLHRLLCRVTGRSGVDPTYCPADRQLIDTLPFSYGWRVHRLERTPLDRAAVTARRGH